MKTPLPETLRRLLLSATISVALTAPALLAADTAAPVVAKSDVNAPVTVTDNGGSWTLDNGIVKATRQQTQRRPGGAHFQTGIDTMGQYEEGRHAGYWEEDPSAAASIGGCSPNPSPSIPPKTAANAPKFPSKASPADKSA
jgi:hypothetical protein